MKLYPIETGKFKLDGGAMFGVVPKTLWEKTNPADSKNLIDMAMRALLIEDGGRLILIDNGLGHKYDAKFQGLYDIDHKITLESSLALHGFGKNDVTDLILTHLHFDHAGGTTEFGPDGKLRLTFPNAKIYLQKEHLALTRNPNVREKASFFKENIEPIVESGLLVELDGEQTALFPNIDIAVTNGHTSSMQHPVIRYKDYTIFYAADFIPTYGHVPVNYVMAYDTQPLLSLDERKKRYPALADANVVIFYEHDPYNECGLITRNERGGFKSGETFPLSNLN